MQDKPKVLFFSVWYPNRYDIMAGLFVRKHAGAASLYADVCVLYLHFDDKADSIQIEEQYSGAIKEILVYIPFKRNKLALGVNFLRGFRKGYKIVKQHFGQPDVIQVNTLTRNGVLAWLLKVFRGIPYVVVEHWTRYLPQNFHYKGFLRRRATEVVARAAKRIMPVSTMLQRAMIEQGIKGDYRLIYNIVDDFFYTTQRKKNDNTKKRILHVSCFLDRQKNISGILQAIKELSRRRSDFELVMVGTGIDFDSLRAFAGELEMPDGIVHWTGEQTPQEVANLLADSDMFVMFSHFETACVVVMESLASGVPLVATPTGIVPDFVDDSNGLIVDDGDVAGLTDKIDYMLDHLSEYNSATISQKAEQFKSASVGKQLFDEYLRALNR